MIIHEINTWKFEELTEDQQQKTIQNYYDINIDHDWWDFTYEDAKNIGIKINGFDIDRGSYCEIENYDSWEEIADKILKDHGKKCDTYEYATEFLKNRDELVKKYSDGIKTNIVAENYECEFDEDCDELDQEFSEDLSNAFLKMLRQEYEYYTSEEAIEETLIANDYDFTDNGKIY